jgi:energy-coupling factor transporter ATP-binding protein EcfA2
MTIKYFSLGDDAAEDDGNLSEYFLDTTESYQDAKNLDSKRYILVGRTGSGKSAILAHIKNSFKDSSNYLCVEVKLSGDYLKVVVQTESFHNLRKAKGLQNILYKLTWQYLIMVCVLREKYGGNRPLKDGRYASGVDLRAYKFMSRVKSLSIGEQTPSDIIMGLIKEISITVQGIGIKGQPEKESNKAYKITNELIKETEDFHEKGFWDVIGGDKLFLLFDDL